MSPQSLLTQFTDRPQAVERIQQVGDDLDEAIEIIRSTIYALGRRGAAGDTGLRARPAAETGRASAILGFSPAPRMTGLLHTLVADRIADRLLAVLREALANVARQAHATAMEISTEASATHLTLQATDNGRGTDPTRTRYGGPATLHTSANELDGTLTLAPRHPTGTTLERTVPLPAGHG
ncbi:sensor histidine kinase [Streptomyces sp. NPDC001100]